MNQEARVIRINDEKITVGCDKRACEGCKGNFFCTQKKKEFEAINPKKVDIKQGDKVNLHIPEGKAIFTVFMSLGLPLILFIPGYFIGRLFTQSEGLLLLSGLIGVGIGFLISFLFFRVRKKEYIPAVESVIEEEIEEKEKEDAKGEPVL